MKPLRAKPCQYFLRRNNESHTYKVQMQVRQLEHKADARFSQRQQELLSRFSDGANQGFKDQREILVTEVSSEVWRRDEQVHDLRTELSLRALHSEDVTQQQCQEYAGQHQHLTGLVHETQQYIEMFEEYRAAQSANGPEIGQLRQREAELPREVRRLMKRKQLQLWRPANNFLCSYSFGAGEN